MQMALTHRSFGTPNNERLEWLGDALLACEVSLLVYERFPQIVEGGLSVIRTQLVNNAALAKLARRIGLEKHMRFGKADMHGGRNNERALAGVMEAYLAAIYLDGGDIRSLLADWLDSDLNAIGEHIRRHGVRALRPAKSLLQEFLQRYGKPLPIYRLIKTDTVNRQSVFSVECRATSDCAHQASAATLAAAEEEAASLCLKQLNSKI